MANHGAAALLLIASLLVVAALSGADARLTVRPNTAAAHRVVAVPYDAHGGYVVDKKKTTPAPAPELSCNKVHGVQAGETCSTVAKGAKLGQDDFLAFNPNINCEDLFVGQWVCLDATAA